MGCCFQPLRWPVFSYIFKKGAKKYARICALDIKLFAKLIKSTKNICNFVYVNTLVAYSILKDYEQLFVVKCETLLPAEERLRTEIERQKQLFWLQHGHKNKQD